LADQHATPKPISEIFVPAYFLLLINPKVHYWKTLGFDTFKIRYYASEKVKILKDKLEPRKKLRTKYQELRRFLETDKIQDKKGVLEHTSRPYRMGKLIDE